LDAPPHPATGACDLHHAVVERWSRGESPLHRRDARAKIASLLVILIVLATAHRQFLLLSAALFVCLGIAAMVAHLPVGAMLVRAASILPFSGVFAIVSWLAGDNERALSLLLKSYLSALAVLLVVGTTPLPSLLRGLELLRLPRFPLMVAQFLYRYLAVISGEASEMRRAAAARAPLLTSATRRLRFRAAAGALAVLFARSYRRAGDIHRAMLARSFSGSFHPLETPRFRTADSVFLLFVSCGAVALRISIERFV